MGLADRGPIGIARSADKGASWGRLVPNLAGAPTHPTTNDPYLFVDPATSRIFEEDLTAGDCYVISWSDDDGALWVHSVSGCTESDHATVFTGPAVTSVTKGYSRIVYRCANVVGTGGAYSAAVICQNSLDGGRTWMTTGGPAYVTAYPGGDLWWGGCSNGVGHAVTDAQGTIYLPKGHCGQPTLAISKDEGRSWTRVQVSNKGLAKDRYGLQTHDAAVGVDRDGTLYFAWLARDALPYLAISRDHGATWSEAVGIAPPGVRDVGLLELAVGAPGRIAVAMVGAEEPDGPAWRGYLVGSLNALDARPDFVGGVVDNESDPFIVGNCHTRCGAMMDFIDVRISPDGTAWAAFVDGCTGSCVQTLGPENDREGVAAHLLGVGLWDGVDPNGPYP
jgi:hypothetical protein